MLNLSTCPIVCGLYAVVKEFLVLMMQQDMKHLDVIRDPLLESSYVCSP